MGYGIGKNFAPNSGLIYSYHNLGLLLGYESIYSQDLHYRGNGMRIWSFMFFGVAKIYIYAEKSWLRSVEDKQILRNCFVLIENNISFSVSVSLRARNELHLQINGSNNG